MKERAASILDILRADPTATVPRRKKRQREKEKRRLLKNSGFQVLMTEQRNEKHSGFSNPGVLSFDTTDGFVHSASLICPENPFIRFRIQGSHIHVLNPDITPVFDGLNYFINGFL